MTCGHFGNLGILGYDDQNTSSEQRQACVELFDEVLVPRTREETRFRQDLGVAQQIAHVPGFLEGPPIGLHAPVFVRRQVHRHTYSNMLFVLCCESTVCGQVR